MILCAARVLCFYLPKKFHCTQPQEKSPDANLPSGQIGEYKGCGGGGGTYHGMSISPNKFLSILSINPQGGGEVCVAHPPFTLSVLFQSSVVGAGSKTSDFRAFHFVFHVSEEPNPPLPSQTNKINNQPSIRIPFILRFFYSPLRPHSRPLRPHPADALPDANTLQPLPSGVPRPGAKIAAPLSPLWRGGGEGFWHRS